MTPKTDASLAKIQSLEAEVEEWKQLLKFSRMDVDGWRITANHNLEMQMKQRDRATKLEKELLVAQSVLAESEEALESCKSTDNGSYIIHVHNAHKIRHALARIHSFNNKEGK